MQNQKTKSDLPEIPDEIAGRPQIALTQFAAESINAEEFRGNDDDQPVVSLSNSPVVFAREKMAQKIDELCKAPPGYEPCIGLTAEQQRIIMGKKYPGQPELDPELGDYTPAFICWLFCHHPRDAHVRYYTRLMPSVGRWIMKEFPDFSFKNTVAPIAMDFSQPPVEGRKIDTIESLRAELAALKAAAVKPPEVEDPEMAKLRAEIAEMKNPSPATAAVPTRRPRPPQA
jgi:hypothetical protein